MRRIRARRKLFKMNTKPNWLKTTRGQRCSMVLLLAGALFNGVSGYAEERPNILFLFTDDQPQSCLGCMGNQHIQTPNLDQLAAEGVLFTEAFVTTAICCSNRTCILTGQYMRRHGIRDFRTPLTDAAFAQSYPSLLKGAGYRTGYLGKFAVGTASPQVRAAFDLWYGFPQRIDFRQQVDGEARYLTDVMTEKAVEFLRTTKSDQPFCLTVAFKEPHGPWNYFDPDVPNVYDNSEIPPTTTFSREDYDVQPRFLRDSLNGDNSLRWLNDRPQYNQYLRTFYRLITRADLAVGQILRELRRLDLHDNTVVIFSSDHGSLLGAHGLSGKWIMYEDSIRVPLIVYDPRHPRRPELGQCKEMVLSIDLAPTILDLADIEIPSSMQGRSLMPLIRGEANQWRSSWYYEHVYNTNPPRSPIVKTEGVRTKRWKYVRYPDVDPPYEQLFDLQVDPLERANLASLPTQSDRLTAFRSQCDNYRRELE